MSIKRMDMFTAICDWPDCGASVMDGSDYAGWGEVETVLETVSDSEWWADRNDERHYCNEHPTVWASDHENGEPFPEPPYLLIHDGDTDNPHDDDGKVSLIGGAA